MAPDDDTWAGIVADTGTLVEEFFGGLADHEAVTYPARAANSETDR
jgi:hypothetical protein